MSMCARSRLGSPLSLDMISDMLQMPYRKAMRTLSGTVYAR